MRESLEFLDRNSNKSKSLKNKRSLSKKSFVIDEEKSVPISPQPDSPANAETHSARDRTLPRRLINSSSIIDETPQSPKKTIKELINESQTNFPPLIEEKTPGGSTLKGSLNSIQRNDHKLKMPKSTFTSNQVMNIKSLLPHQEALKDNKHTIYLTHLQKTTTDYVAEGQTFRVNKVINGLHLHGLSSHYKYEELHNRFAELTTDNQTQIPLNKNYSPLHEESIQTDFTSIAFLKSSSRFGLTVELVPESQKRSILKMRSCLESLKNLSHVYKFRKKTERLNEMLFNIQKILGLIITFLYDARYEKGVDYTKAKLSGEPISERQAIMKEMGVIDTLMDLI